MMKNAFSKLSIVAILVIVSGFIEISDDREYFEITAENLEDGAIQLTGKIYEHVGDISGAHEPGFDDSSWQMPTNIWRLATEFEDDWDHILWFRYYLKVDSALVGKPLSLSHNGHGAHKIWLNGELVDSTGVVSGNLDIYEGGKARNWKVFSFDEREYHVIAVQMSNPDVEIFQKRQFGLGFHMAINYPERSRESSLQTYRFSSGTQMFMIGFSSVFAILHLIFYFFNRRLVFNLWFSIVCILFSVSAFLNHQWAFMEDIRVMMVMQAAFQSVMILNFMFLALFMRSILKLDITKYFKIFMIVVTAMALWNFFGSMPNMLVVVAAVLIGIEIFRIGVLGVRRGKKGAWVISGGIATFVISIFLVIGLEMAGFQGEYGKISIFHLPYLGFVIALVGMSVYQSLHLADLNMNLLQKLDEVKELSETNLKHERSIRESEIKRVVLEKENERKTAELDKARQLQLSLLPGCLPEQSGYNICAEMFTASEVGGDYYDFIVKDDGSMIWALGDATGHGTEAGIVAAMTKTMFLSLAVKYEPDRCLREMSAGLKNTGIRQKYMCLGLLTVKGDLVSWCAAGIPAAMVIRNNGESDVEILESKGMPLGSVTNYKYQISETRLNPGDVIIIMSDGLSEQMNAEREEFGEERIMEYLKKNSSKNPEEIAAALKSEMDTWRGDLQQQDDLTMVCLKRLS